MTSSSGSSGGWKDFIFGQFKVLRGLNIWHSPLKVGLYMACICLYEATYASYTIYFDPDVLDWSSLANTKKTCFQIGDQ